MAGVVSWVWCGATGEVAASAFEAAAAMAGVAAAVVAVASGGLVEELDEQGRSRLRRGMTEGDLAMGVVWLVEPVCCR